MASNLFRLNIKDFAKGISVAVAVVILQVILTALQGNGVEGFLGIDWAATLDLALKAAGAYLLKNLVSDSEGKVLGKIG